LFGASYGEGSGLISNGRDLLFRAVSFEARYLSS